VNWFLSLRGAPATKQSSPFGQLRAPSPSRGWIAAARVAHLAMTIGLVSAVASVARAHDPSESWTNAVLQPDGLKVQTTMAPVCATLLLDPSGKLPGVSEDSFPEFHDRLKALAAQLYVITSGKTPLKPREVEVRLTEELDLEFTLVYPRPAAGRLHFHASFLGKLGTGFNGMIFLTDSERKDLGWDQISAEYPNLEVTIPAPPPAKKTP
jgi:hypothetical protein